MNSELNSIGLNKKPSDTTVVVAMSGGVDSSTVAAMMKKEGYRVIGITLNFADLWSLTIAAGYLPRPRWW